MKDFSIPISSYLNFFPRDYEENLFLNFIYLFIYFLVWGRGDNDGQRNSHSHK